MTLRRAQDERNRVALDFGGEGHGVFEELDVFEGGAGGFFEGGVAIFDALEEGALGQVAADFAQGVEAGNLNLVVVIVQQARRWGTRSSSPKSPQALAVS